jgi:hypothetical protein
MAKKKKEGIPYIHPIGLKPKFLGVEARLYEIYSAKKRYTEEHVIVPVEWITEELELLLWLSINCPNSDYIANQRKIC